MLAITMSEITVPMQKATNSTPNHWLKAFMWAPPAGGYGRPSPARQTASPPDAPFPSSRRRPAARAAFPARGLAGPPRQRPGGGAPSRLRPERFAAEAVAAGPPARLHSDVSRARNQH